MQAKDVMTSPAVTISPETTVREIAQTLLNKRISAVPVVTGDGRPVGIVSEGDLMRRVETGTVRRPWWLSWLVEEPESRARDYVKSHGTLARDVMSADVVTVAADMPLEKIAPLLEQHRIKRVPVVDVAGTVIGVVSRANLLHGLAVRKTPTPQSNDDASLREALVAAVQETGIDTHLITMTVTDGVAEIWGSVRSKDEQRALRVAAEAVPGMTKIDNRVGLIPRGLLPAS